MSSRLAVLGGMFDPVHNGHIEAAHYALRKLAINRLKMIPCHIPNPKHKPSANTGANHRLAMLNLAVADEEQIEVDPIEINRAGVSYTIDTLIALKPLADSVVFVLGVDSFNSLPQWHRWAELLDLCHFLVLARPGSAISQSTGELLAIEQRLVQTAQQMFSAESGKIIYAEDFKLDISSTSLRAKLAASADVAGQLNAQVFSYIKQNHLYGLR
jgi:nicotinate-nucleotide adenylyltransferase